MKILFVAADSNPFTKQKGGSSQRTHLLVEAIAQIASVDVAVFANEVISDIPNCNVIFSRFINVWNLGFNNRIKKIKRLTRPFNPYSFYPVVEEASQEIQRIINRGQYDYICVRYLDTVLTCGLLTYADRLIVDVDDYPVDEMKRNANLAHTMRARIYYYLLGIIMRHSMNQVIDKCRCVFSPTKPQWKNPTTAWLPNIPYYSKPKQDSIVEHKNSCILFVGGLSFLPNRRGIEHFIQHVYPLILQEIPDIHFNIVGDCPDEELRIKIEGYTNVKVKGYVENLMQEYSLCDLCVAPIYAGAGTNIKVIEALQMCKPCVVTPSAYRGYEMLKDGEDIIVANNDAEYAQAVISLLKSPPKMKMIAQNGYAKYQKFFSKEYFLKIVKETVLSLS